MGKVSYNQTGYVGSSMSENAVLAYNAGEKPKSKWTKTQMIATLKTYCEEFDLAYDATIEKMTKATIFDAFFRWTSWHHTGKFANETDFYGLDDSAVLERFRELSPDEIERRDAERQRLQREHDEQLAQLSGVLARAWQAYTTEHGFEPDTVAAALESAPEICDVRISKKGNEIVEVNDGGTPIICNLEDAASRRLWHYSAIGFDRSDLNSISIEHLEKAIEALES